jgi:hypothetical protein
MDRTDSVIVKNLLRFRQVTGRQLSSAYNTHATPMKEQDGGERPRFSQTEFLVRSALAGGFAGGLVRICFLCIVRVFTD